MEYNVLGIILVVLLVIAGIVMGYLVAKHISEEKSLYKALTNVTHIGGSEFIYKSHVKLDHQPGTITVTALCIYSGGGFVLSQMYKFHIDGPATIRRLKEGGKLSIQFLPESGLFFLQDQDNKIGYAGSVVE
jgi:hypothetical protein